ncbi:alpha/beta hydrolase [Nonomuraea sp. 3-1Str]|uniref:alpha/beta fold hydrolase n=1 Tax=Nonomuraea sp. 3-1Str TaxID=2929801 RepID=UPI002861CC8E|nr:alpha/beta hydrolase [Nonomuraea sp. 3-1Str]MDR8414126.1 alpha/beta hydrolase [Nonomuraea sp. 3-1Str]
MNNVVSSDGTVIAYDRVGQGPAVVLVDGAMCHRAAGPNPALAQALAARFTVYTYDRRGRGESGDIPSGREARFDPRDEIDDLAALVKEAGDDVRLYGISSGAALALAAVDAGLPVSRLAVYEPPFVVDGSRPPVPADFEERMRELVATGRRSDAVRSFMRAGVGLPAVMVAMMRLMPAWSGLKAVAHTLPYDLALAARYQRGEPIPAGTWAGVTVPTLVIDGGKSPAWMRDGVRAVAGALPAARHRTLEGQTHLVKADALAPVLAEFFA